MSTYDWVQLRLKPNVTDDPDFVDNQAAPADLHELPSVGDGSGTRPVTIEIVAEYLDAMNATVTGVGRGSFDAQFIRVIDRPDGAGTTILDSATLTAVPAFRPILIDDARTGDSVGLRITNVTPPAGGTQMRVFIREQPES